MTICWNSQSGNGVKVIGSLDWFGAIFEHTVQLALAVRIEVFILGQYTDSLAQAFMLTLPWYAECRLCKIFTCWVVGMTILWSKSTRLLSVLKCCLISQYSWTSGAVRLHVLGNPFCISSISLVYCGSLCLAAWMRSSEVSAISLFTPNIANRVVDLTQSFMSLDTVMSDREGSAGSMFRSACKIVTELWEIASEALCLFPGQCWRVSLYLKAFSFILNSCGFWILLQNNPFSGSWSVTTIRVGQPMENMWYFSNAHAIAAASPSIGMYLNFGMNAESTADKYQALAFRTANWGFVSGAWTMLLQE